MFKGRYKWWRNPILWWHERGLIRGLNEIARNPILVGVRADGTFGTIESEEARHVIGVAIESSTLDDDGNHQARIRVGCED